MTEKEYEIEDQVVKLLEKRLKVSVSLDRNSDDLSTRVIVRLVLDGKVISESKSGL